MNIFRKKEKNQAVRNGEMQAQQVKGIARTCQDVMDFEGFLADETGDGIMVVKNGKIYSKMYRLVDSNFVTEPEDRQLEILEKFEKLLNRFAEIIDISFVIVNKRNTVAEMVKAFHLQESGDKYDQYRKDYNEVIDKKIEELLFVVQWKK